MTTAPFVLHNFHTSSASHRVRIAMHLKGLPFAYVSVPIMDNAGEAMQRYRTMNPQALVPTLEHGDVRIAQSLAILEYLEEIAPSPSLFPSDAAGRARVRSIAQYVVSEIQPMQNLRVQRHLAEIRGAGSAQDEVAALGLAWRRHWVTVGLTALEAMLNDGKTGQYCHGDAPTIADCCLVPQVFSAIRWGLDVDAYPTIARIAATAAAHPAFQEAAPENQPDAK